MFFRINWFMFINLPHDLFIFGGEGLLIYLIGFNLNAWMCGNVRSMFFAASGIFFSVW